MRDLGHLGAVERFARLGPQPLPAPLERVTDLSGRPRKRDCLARRCERPAVSRYAPVSITARDRKRLWGKSGGCARCNRPLTHPGQGGARETVIGEEAHIVGERPGAARYEPLRPAVRDAYENRILLCPTDHTVVDAEPEYWTVGKLHALKEAHEQRMTALTAEARSDGLQFHLPPAVMLEPVIGGRQLLNIIGPAYAYMFDADEFDSAQENEAAKALGDAHDYGEIYSMISPAEQIDAAQRLSEVVRDAMRAGLLLKGKRIEVDVTDAQGRQRWPVAILHLRRAADVGAEQAAAKETEEALREGGIEGLEAWAEAARRREG
jgi:hypothetical protein